jgi:hypothetical protein
LGILSFCLVEVRCLSSKFSSDNGPGGATYSSCCLIQTLLPSFSQFFIVNDLSFVRGVSSFVWVIDLDLLDRVPPFSGETFLFLFFWVEYMC